MTRPARRYGGVEWEDVLQDALVLAWRKRDRSDPVRGTALTWLLTLTTDAARKRHRRHAAHARARRLGGRTRASATSTSIAPSRNCPAVGGP